ncbi:subtilisin-like protein [Backusella circina FSU 941]|nr:subtilisin-like protein [Backusella circina FSU 941]
MSIGNFHWYMDRIDEADVEKLNQREDILHIHKDQPVFHITEQVQKESPSWGLDRIDQRKGRNNEFHFPSSAGEGVDVYIIDTGININHLDFGGRAIHGPTFTTGSKNSNPTDNNGHGTFVAGVCCGQIYGVAKKAKITSLKVLDQEGSGKLSNILKAIRWVVEQHKKKPEFHLPINQAIEEAIEIGIHFSIAAGNQGSDACRYSPSSVKNALVVGAIDKDDTIAKFSNFGPCVDLYAPGTFITSLWYNTNRAIHVLSGTSMAAPHITGAMAILLSQQDYTPFELIQSLKESATVSISSRTRSNEVAEEISHLIGLDMDDQSLIKIIYIDPSLDFFSETDDSFIRSSARIQVPSYFSIFIMSLILMGNH